MVSRVIKTLVYITIIFSLSFTAVYLLSRGTLEAANKPLKIITSDSYNEAAKNNLNYGDYLKITGTPNLLHQVSQESKESNSENRIVDYYYVGLKEYGSDFVVRLKPGKLQAEQQVFEGKVIGLTQTEYGTRIKNSLNKPINFDESINKDAANELDLASQKEIAEESSAEYTNSSFLVLDEEIPDLAQVNLNIAFWTIILGVFVVTLFRKRVFGI